MSRIRYAHATHMPTSIFAFSHNYNIIRKQICYLKLHNPIDFRFGYLFVIDYNNQLNISILLQFIVNVILNDNILGYLKLKYFTLALA